MVKGEDFIKCFINKGYSFSSGVPCSYLSPIYKKIENDNTLKYLAASNEGEGISICVGAWLAGQKSILFCQNSGIGNIINPVTSLLQLYQIPILIISSLRGSKLYPDEPQHFLMGKITKKLLDLMMIKNFTLNSEENFEEVIEKADNLVNKGISSSLLLEKNFLLKENLGKCSTLEIEEGERKILKKLTKEKLFLRYEMLEAALSEISKNHVIISNLGNISRELYMISDEARNFYMFGSMGFASSIGLGVSLNTSKKVIIFDGDGSLLMHLGNLTTIGKYAPKNLIHILFNNGIYESTGGQNNNYKGDFAKFAAAANYKKIYITDNIHSFKEILKNSLNNEGPIFIEVKIAPGSFKNLARPTITPVEIAARFKNFMQTNI